MTTAEGEKVAKLIQGVNYVLDKDARGEIRLQPSERNFLDNSKTGCEDMLNSGIEKGRAKVLLAESWVAQARNPNIQLEMFDSRGRPTLPVDANGKPIDGGRHSQRNQRNGDVPGQMDMPADEQAAIKEILTGQETPLTEEEQIEAAFAQHIHVGTKKEALAALQAQLQSLDILKSTLELTEKWEEYAGLGFVLKVGRRYMWEGPAKETEDGQAETNPDQAEAGEPETEATAAPGWTPPDVNPQVPSDIFEAIAEALAEGKSRVQSIMAAFKAEGNKCTKTEICAYFEQLVRENRVARLPDGKWEVRTLMQAMGYNDPPAVETTEEEPATSDQLQAA